MRLIWYAVTVFQENKVHTWYPPFEISAKQAREQADAILDELQPNDPMPAPPAGWRVVDELIPPEKNQASLSL